MVSRTGVAPDRLGSSPTSTALQLQSQERYNLQFQQGQQQRDNKVKG